MLLLAMAISPIFLVFDDLDSFFFQRSFTFFNVYLFFLEKERER